MLLLFPAKVTKSSLPICILNTHEARIRSNDKLEDSDRIVCLKERLCSLVRIPKIQICKTLNQLLCCAGRETWSQIIFYRKFPRPRLGYDAKRRLRNLRLSSLTPATNKITRCFASDSFVCCAGRET